MWFSAISFSLEGLPLLRTLWRWMMERGFEIQINPQGQYELRDPNEEVPSWMYGRMNLVLINHRTDRLERVIGAQVLLKRRAFWLWHRTIISTPLRLVVGTSRRAITNIEMKAVSEPYAAEVSFEDSPDAEQFGRRMDVILELQMVGPIRRIERRLASFTNKPLG